VVIGVANAATIHEPQPEQLLKPENKTGQRLVNADPLIRLVGTVGFELTTPCTPCKCATWLRYAPTKLKL
jgi:hypothetical protein